MQLYSQKSANKNQLIKNQDQHQIDQDQDYLNNNNQLIDQTINQVVKVYRNAEELEEYYRYCLQELEMVRGESEVMEGQIEKLCILQRMLHQFCQVIETQQFSIQQPLPQNNYNLNSNSHQSILQTKPNPNPQILNQIQVQTPDLTNIHQYLTQVSNPQTIQKYIQSQNKIKQQEIKCNEQICKLQEKLRQVDEKVNETLAGIRNQRKLL